MIKKLLTKMRRGNIDTLFVNKDYSVCHSSQFVLVYKMPKVNEREKVLKMLRRLLSQHLHTCSKLVELDAYSDDEEEMTSVLFFLFASVSSLRYFKA
jgi:hypothetical protein